MGKPGAQAMNIFQTQGIKNNPEKGRYSDPQIEGLGSPYNKRSCGSNYKQTSSQTATFGPEGSNPNKEVYDGIVAKSSNKQVIKNPLGRGINTLNSQNNQKDNKEYGAKATTQPKKNIGPKKDCGCPKNLESCNCG